MRILALDTTSAFGSIALLEDREVLEEVPLHAPDGFSQILFGAIGRLLAKHGCEVADIGCFAATAGPGSFTGVRVGLTAAKGLAEAVGARAVGVSNLKALAACGSADVRAAVIDARRGEVYGAVYDRRLQAVQPEIVAPFRDWAAGLPPGIGEVISPDFTPFRPHFGLNLPVVEVRSVAGVAGQIAFEELRAGLKADPASVDANYVRRSDAELNWSDR